MAIFTGLNNTIIYIKYPYLESDYVPYSREAWIGSKAAQRRCEMTLNALISLINSCKFYIRFRIITELG